MIIHINKHKLENTFFCKSEDYDVLTDNMLNDLLDCESWEEFRMNCPESYNHYHVHFRGKVSTPNPTYEDILFEVFNITLEEEEDDEDYEDDDYEDDEY